ncbi:AAA family ATPase [Bradyrhizobium sp. RDI18]|uniref:AAA family ATPase n=1 Tax=Bradyrhizobium sp. RDI18 TaxID=3367400 RepID=UPI00371AA00F
MQCRNCGQENAPRNKFCFNCGVQLDVSTLMELQRERKQATALFADIVGSTELIANLDAESAGRRLQPAVEAMMQAVGRFGGTILHTLGDGLDAIFGAPRAQDGHALLACQAALAMQEAVAALPLSTEIRIGIHSGEVVASPRGDVFGHEAQGLVLHIASRLEREAEPGGILLSMECKDLVSNYCETRPAGVRTLRGVPEPITVFRLIGLKPGVVSDRFRTVGLSPFRGRQVELEFLKQAVLDAENNAGRVIGIVAHAGMGKSRLCYEFGEWCRQRNVKVLEGRAQVFGKSQSMPLLAVLELLRAFFRVTTTLDPKIARTKIQERLLALDATFVDDLPYLLNLLGLPAPELATERADPKAWNVRLRNLVKRMVVAAGRRTSVIIFEDLHWLDDLSQDFLTAIAEAVEGTKIVMVVNYRPTWSPPWSIEHFTELALTELDGGDIQQLVRDLIGDAPDLVNIVTDVAQQSDGNPFFAEELVRALAQSGALLGERGGYRIVSSDWLTPTLPATIEAVIGARIDLLPAFEKAALQIGAVIGKEFPLAIAMEVSGIPEQEIKKLLSRLCDLDLITASSSVDKPGYSFRHPLIQEVAYAMQLRSRRAQLHSSVASAIERTPWGAADESANLLAYHCEAAGRVLEAAMHLRRAALWVGRTNSSQALAEWKKVRWLLRDQPRDPAVDQLRALANGRVLGFAWSEGLSADDVNPYAEEALQYAREAGDRKHEALLLGAYGRVFAASGAADDYIGLARQGVAAAAASGDRDVFVACNAQLCQAYLLAGYLRESLVANDTAVAADDERSGAESGVVLGLNASQIFGFDVGQWLRCLRTRTLVLIGQFEAAEACLATALQADRSKAIPVVQYHAHLAAVEMAFHRGNNSIARLHAKEVEGYASQSGMTYLFTASRLCRALASSTEGDFASASSDLYEALTTARKSKTGLEIEARLLAYLAHVLDLAGEKTRAAQVVSEAIDVARRRTDRIAELHAHIVAADLALAGGAINPELREEHLEKAKALLDVTGAEIFAPSLHDLSRGQEKIANQFVQNLVRSD